MKVLLVNPYIYDFTAYDLWLKPLGLLYVASVLKQYTDCELYWLDTLDRFQENAVPEGDSSLKKAQASGRGKFYREVVEKPPIYEDTPRVYSRYGIPFARFLEKIDAVPEPDLILVTSLMTYWIDGVNITIDTLKERFPAARVVLGGVLPTLAPVAHVRNQVKADYFIEGYGEPQILDIVKAHGGKVYRAPGFSEVNDIPYPAVEFLSNHSALPLITARGCPFRCTYCASDKLNVKFLERSTENILGEIYGLYETYGTKHFIIFDDALLINKKRRFLKVFRKVKEDLSVHFHTPNGLHVREIDLETAEVFYGCGFKTLRLSLESTSAEILKKSGNKVTVRQMIGAVENLEAAGYERKEIGVYLIFGLPGQRVEDVEVALRFVGDLGVIPHLSYFTPVPGTVDFINLQKSGEIATPVNFHETNKIYFLYNKSGLSLDEIQHLKDLSASISNGLIRAA
ncbi:MAG: B12-binding domain-containing radical SAM protein [bacterium]|nr:B12-binding domain-containing radical SAM protein [bacterium]